MLKSHIAYPRFSPPRRDQPEQFNKEQRNRYARHSRATHFSCGNSRKSTQSNAAADTRVSSNSTKFKLETAMQGGGIDKD